jgi:hypothetical protein
LELRLDDSQYPSSVGSARLDIRWFDGGDYSVHYLELDGEKTWQCRWDRHPKPGAPLEHFHAPPDATTVEPSPLEGAHHLDVLFWVFAWIDERVQELFEE